MTHTTNAARSAEMARKFRSGETMQRIGSTYGLSRERVRCILKHDHRITGTHGGRAVAAAARAAAKVNADLAIVDAKARSLFGVSSLEFQRIIGQPPVGGLRKYPIARAYLAQIRTATARGIEWHFNLAQWWAVWLGSGKWGMRGRGRGYCMARIGDVGPYATENVYICSVGQNASDSLEVKPAAMRRPPGRGWSYRPEKRPKDRPYIARYRNRHLGNFATQGQAESAYLAARDSYRLSKFGIAPQP